MAQEALHIVVGEMRPGCGDLVGGQIPPCGVIQAVDLIRSKAHPDDLRRVACDDGIVRHGPCDDRSRADDHAISDPRARQDQGPMADPDIVPNDRVGLIAQRVDEIGPALRVENLGRVAGDRIAAVICARGDEANPVCDLTEFANDQPFGAAHIEV